jgi:hypothetical protein
MVPFKKLTFRMTLIVLLLHAVLSHEIFFFESTYNGHVDCKIEVNLLNLRDTRNVWENQWCIMSVDLFKGIHVSGSMVRGVVPPFN